VVRCPIQTSGFVAKTRCFAQPGRFFNHRAPFRYRKFYAQSPPCDGFFASAQRLKPVARIRQAFRRVPLFFYPSPSRVQDRAADIRLTCVSRVSAVSRPACLSRDFRLKRTAGLPGHPDCTIDLRPSSITVGLLPFIRHDSRRAFQVEWTSASTISAFD